MPVGALHDFRAWMLRRKTLFIAALAIAAIGCAAAIRTDRAEPAPGGAVAVEDYLTPDLRARVERLKQDAAATPTNAENLSGRLDVLWPWANAYALQGWPIDPDLPYYVAVSRSPSSAFRVDSPRSRVIYAAFDGWIREFALREANPEAIGSLTSPYLGPFTVDTHGEIKQVYTVGDRPLVPGDGFLISMRGYGGSAPLQITDPAADNYVTITTSRDGVAFETSQLPVNGMFSGALGGFQIDRPFLRLSRGELRKGDTVTLTFGDRSGGSRGLAFATTQSTGMRYRIWLHLDRENIRFNLPELPFVLEGGRVAEVRAFAPSVVAAGETFDLSVRAGDRFRNRATGPTPGWRVRLNGATVRETAPGGPSITVLRGLSIDSPGIYTFEVESLDGALRAQSNPVLVERTPSRRIYWGETHGHSGFAEGSGTVDGFFDFAKNDARLDFVTLSEHDLWMDDFEWESLRRAVKTYAEPKRLITFLGYEWTVNASEGGHHNVLFRTPEERDRIGRQGAPTLPDLHRQLDERYDVEDVIVLPHAHQPGDWKISDPDLEPFVEIVSNHGTFEWFGRAYLAQGHQVGFLGGSDDHIGHPGLRPLRDAPGSDNFGGLAAVIAPEKTGDAIFDAIRDRSGYATNGFRIILDAALSGSRMGLRTGALDERRIEGRVIGTAPIEEIVIVKNGQTVHREGFIEAPPNQFDRLEVKFFSESQQPRWGTESRGWRRWEGRIEIVGAALKGASAPKNENTLTEYVRISRENPRVVEFALRTRGLTKGVELELEGFGRNSEVRVATRGQQGAEGFTHTFSGSDVRDGPRTVIAPQGQYSDEVTLRAIRTPTERVRTFSWIDPEPFTAGDSYFVRVQQIDGGLAWSSPFWTGGEPPR